MYEQCHLKTSTLPFFSLHIYSTILLLAKSSVYTSRMRRIFLGSDDIIDLTCKLLMKALSGPKFFCNFLYLLDFRGYTLGLSHIVLHEG